MKNVYTLVAAISLLVLVAIFLPKSCEKVELFDNSEQLNRIDILKTANDSIKALSDSLLNNYSEEKVVKDSIVFRIKTRYISVFDTISNEVVECLPKVHVDSLISTYESLILDADTIIGIQQIHITNLIEQNNIKDTLINNYQLNEKVLMKSVKKERRNKWLFGGVGAGIGYLIGKIM